MSCCPKFRAGPNVINLAKFSDEEPVIQIDWSQRPLASTDEIQSSVWEVRPSGSPMSAISQGFAGQITSAQLTGGAEQHVYLLLNTVTILDVYGSTQVLTQELQVYIQDQSAPSPPPPCPPPPGAVMDVVSLSPQIVTERDGDIVTVTYAGITDVIAGDQSISIVENDGVVSVSLVEFPDAPSDVYVDSVSGSDAQDGLTPATAVATIARAREIVGPYVGSACTVHVAPNPSPAPVYQLEDLLGLGKTPAIQAPAKLRVLGTNWDTLISPVTVVTGTQVSATVGATWTVDAWVGYQLRVVSATNPNLVGVVRTILENGTGSVGLSAPLPVALQPGDTVEVVRPAARASGGVWCAEGTGVTTSWSGVEIFNFFVEGALTFRGGAVWGGVVFNAAVSLEPTCSLNMLGGIGTGWDNVFCGQRGTGGLLIFGSVSRTQIGFVTLGNTFFQNASGTWQGRANQLGFFNSLPGNGIGASGNTFGARARSIVGIGQNGVVLTIGGAQSTTIAYVEVRTSGSTNGVLCDVGSYVSLSDTATFPLSTVALRAQNGSRVRAQAGSGSAVANWYLGQAGNPNTTAPVPAINTGYQNAFDFSSITRY